jgi:glycosyltransferase involved in cell wall biosynthesis
MATTRLSVIIPVLNEETSIGACLSALAAQADSIGQILLVDNGCTDGTLAIAASYPGVTVLTEPRRGIAHARTTGFDAAEEAVLARIDADTVVQPGWGRAILGALRDGSGVDGLAGPAGFSALSGGGVVVGRSAYAAFRGIHRLFVGHGPLLYGHNMAITRRGWLAVRELVNEDADRTSEDIDVALALLHTGHAIGYEPQMLVTIGIERTVRPGKLAGYVGADRVTKAKYRAVRAGRAGVTRSPAGTGA